jgi:ABC-type transporter Mla maintaining outer membrane lipid asymmetry ATPase subunit MlaF
MNCIEMHQVRLEVDGQCYLDGADLTVAQGESVVIAGIPGCGKSFVPRLLLGLPGMEDDHVDVQGSVIVAGDSVLDLSSRGLQMLRRRVGSVMRDGALIENMDIRSNVTLPLTYHYQDTLGPDEIQERCDAVLEDLQLSHLGTPQLRPVAINREERRYASLARALVCEPFLLLLDELCVGLSPASAQRLCRRAFFYRPSFVTPLPEEPEAQSLKRTSALTRIATTVDLGCYLNVADRFVLLWDGRLETIGDRAAVTGSSDPRVRQLLDVETEDLADAPELAGPLHG